MRVLKETNIGKIMLSKVQYIIFIGICVCTFSVNSAVDIVVCEDDEGNKTFQKACPPGTFVVGEKKFSVGKDSSKQVDLSKLNIILLFLNASLSNHAEQNLVVKTFVQSVQKRHLFVRPLSAHQ